MESCLVMHLFSRFGQTVGFVDHDGLVVPQQRSPSVLPVESVGQQVIVVADLDGYGRAVRFSQIPLVTATAARGGRAAGTAQARRSAAGQKPIDRAACPGRGSPAPAAESRPAGRTVRRAAPSAAAVPAGGDRTRSAPCLWPQYSLDRSVKNIHIVIM